MRALAKLSVLSTLSVLGFACGGDDVSTAQPVISDFSLDKTTVNAGQTVKLSWATTDADIIEIYRGVEATPFFMGTAASGSTDSPPLDEAIDFTLLAKNSESGFETRAMASVTSVGGIRIASFTASPMAPAEDEPVTLSWVIGGETPSEVLIVDKSGAELHKDESPENSGSFDVVLPVPDDGGTTAEYRLKVRGPSGRVEAMVTININVIIDQPVIVDFFAASPDVAKGDRAQITWEVSNTVEVQVSINGTVARPFTASGVPNGNTRITINDDVNLFLLEAKSEDGVIVSQELTVNGLNVPVIDTLQVTPASYTTGSTVATVTWQTTYAASNNLQVNGRDVSGFPRDQASGTFQFPVTGLAVVNFIATNAVQDTAQSFTIELGFDEPEPNDSAALAMPIAADGISVRGTITTIDDVDWYVFMVPQGSFLYAQAGYDDVSGCAFDTILRLYDADGTTELGFEDNTTAPNISPCAEINPLVSNYAARLAAGTYYISVGGSGVMTTGQYSLTVRVLTPVADIPGRMTALKIGDPSWKVSDFVQFTAPLDGMAMNPFLIGLGPLFSPMHSPAVATGLGVLMGTDTPHTPDYDTEMQMGLNMRAQASGALFPAADIVDPGALYVGFTISPTATATMGRSIDALNGPIIARSLYPISVELDFEVGGMAVPDLKTEYDLVFGGAMGLDGTSHEHVFAVVLANAGTAPADLANVYSWEYTVLDVNNAGYTFSVPFELR